jgi:predicted protein tyrosine phosphatase
MRKVLFVCTMNKLRSKTAETIYQERDDLDVQSAGVAKGADRVVTREMMEWADVVFVMERRHRNKLRKFPDLFSRKTIVCLYIEDEYDYMQPELVVALKHALRRYLG